MAINDITFAFESGALDVPTQRWQVQLGSTTINPGEPVRFVSQGSRYVQALATAEPQVDITPAMVGVASDVSSQTGTADGVVDVHDLIPGVTYLCAARVAANVATVAQYRALEGKRVLFNLTAGVYTIDTAVADAEVNGLIIVPLRDNTRPPYQGKVAFKIRSQASYLDGCCAS